ncbi:MAG TPA: dethiobiotin synthase [Porticoccaceae bacterium]|nr:dethiobiotin synthase [Porticoccaceae bacterium]HCO61180.1 dethiobiotin synthase [Porticoccaceae bacterium]
MGAAYFVTGTDTGVGKTTAAAALLWAARNKGLSTLGIKPVASGSEWGPDGLRNEDALCLRQASSIQVGYAQTNPVALEPAIAPHYAARTAGITLDIEALVSHCRSMLVLGADITLIEGAGGWRVPLNEKETFADLAKQLGLPVILVVDIRLGCLNHALLSAESITNDGLILAGWIANAAEGRDNSHEWMVADLGQRLACPLLGDLPHEPVSEAPKVLASRLVLDKLLPN